MITYWQIFRNWVPCTHVWILKHVIFEECSREYQQETCLFQANFLISVLYLSNFSIIFCIRVVILTIGFFMIEVKGLRSLWINNRHKIIKVVILLVSKNYILYLVVFSFAPSKAFRSKGYTGIFPATSILLSLLLRYHTDL